jgi:hypothetical protein
MTIETVSPDLIVIGIGVKSGKLEYTPMIV